MGTPVTKSGKSIVLDEVGYRMDQDRMRRSILILQAMVLFLVVVIAALLFAAYEMANRLEAAVTEINGIHKSIEKTLMTSLPEAKKMAQEIKQELEGVRLEASRAREQMKESSSEATKAMNEAADRALQKMPVVLEDYLNRNGQRIFRQALQNAQR